MAFESKSSTVTQGDIHKALWLLGISRERDLASAMTLYKVRNPGIATLLRQLADTLGHPEDSVAVSEERNGVEIEAHLANYRKALDLYRERLEAECERFAQALQLPSMTFTINGKQHSVDVPVGVNVTIEVGEPK